jgi:PadR family transcriptional regulator PadR
MSKPSDLVQGTLDMLLLKILALEPMNGFAVSQRLKQVSGDVLQVSDGSLYPALHKLEQEGWITAEWKTSEYGRRAKYYSLTRLGRRQIRTSRLACPDENYFAIWRPGGTSFNKAPFSNLERKF